MNVQKFLQKKEFETVEDFEYQAEYLAYVVAKHYNISLYDVYKMPLSIFKQSLIWAMAIQEEQVKENKRAEQEAKAKNREQLETIVRQMNATKDGKADEKARNFARRNFHKLMLAYQLAAAIQGGTGG